jgi:rubrerythrin
MPGYGCRQEAVGSKKKSGLKIRFHGGNHMDQDREEILQKAIDIEVFGYNYYNKLKNIVESREGKGLLGFLANAEEEHQKYLLKVCRKLGHEPKITELGDLIADVLMDEGQEKIFRSLMDKSDLTNVDAIDAIKLGMGVEANSIKFYADNAMKSPDEDVVKLFTELSEWEKEHLDLLKENLRMLKDEGTWYGYTPILEG